MFAGFWELLLLVGWSSKMASSWLQLIFKIFNCTIIWSLLIHYNCLIWSPSADQQQKREETEGEQQQQQQQQQQRGKEEQEGRGEEAEERQEGERGKCGEGESFHWEQATGEKRKKRCQAPLGPWYLDAFNSAIVLECMPLTPSVLKLCKGSELLPSVFLPVNRLFLSSSMCIVAFFVLFNFDGLSVSPPQ